MWEGRENCTPDHVSEKYSFTSGQKHLHFLPGRRDVRQGKIGEKDTAREASEGDWSSLTMFLMKSPFPSADTHICLTQLCCLFFFKKKKSNTDKSKIRISACLDETTALLMMATIIFSLD